MTKFTEQQPQDGDIILRCAHLLETKIAHWYKVPEVEFVSPSGERGVSEWIGICADCFRENPNPTTIEEFPIAGHSTWHGDEPAIEVDPLQPERRMDGPNPEDN
ncbi:MAG: hypothetical protein ACXADB_09635 [Candidatus Hermodarchaeia archaeon]|jgi:hypothetical protein